MKLVVDGASSNASSNKCVYEAEMAGFGVVPIAERVFDHGGTRTNWSSNGDIGIVTILHERMHQIDRFREDFS